VLPSRNEVEDTKEVTIHSDFVIGSPEALEKQDIEHEIISNKETASVFSQPVPQPIDNKIKSKPIRKPLDRPKEVKLMEERAQKRKEKRDLLNKQYEEKRRRELEAIAERERLKEEEI
jgi:hypothetical protein